jgi:uncharacterized membrane protein
MNTSAAFVAVSIVVLAIIAILVFVAGRNRGENRLRPLAGLAWAFVLAGLFFGENRVIGYSLMGIGVVLAVVDIINRSRSR